MFFGKRRYLSYLHARQKAFSDAGRVLAHEAYGFPLTLHPIVYPAHPDFSHSAAVIIDNLPADMSDMEVLDIGTGTGVIAIAAALRGARVVACDNEPAAVAIARSNVRANGLAERVKVVDSDLFAGLPAQRFDLITANLWFPIRIKGFDHDHAEMMAIYRRFLAEVSGWLKPGGTVMLSSGAFADIAGIRRLFREAGLRPKRTCLRARYDEGRVRMDWYMYRFGAPIDGKQSRA